jgi:hypothetical protein
VACFIRESIPQEYLIIREENNQKALDAIASADLIRVVQQTIRAGRLRRTSRW